MFNFFTKKRIYLDNAGATEMQACAKRALAESLSIFGNPSAIHKEGVLASKLLDKARVSCAKVLNSHAYEIYFVGTGTESCNFAVLGTYRGFIESRKLKTENSRPHIIVSCIEHPAVLEPVKYLEKQNKISVTYLPVYEDGIVKINDIRNALCEETILVSVMYGNNEIGTIQPVKEIGRAIEEWKKEKGRTHASYPYFHTDACQAGNYLDLDVVRLRAHLMSVNSGKVYGPKGIALLYKREGIKIGNIFFGGGQERGLRSGTESVSLAYAFSVALLEAEELKNKESKRLQELNDYFLLEAKKEIKDITFYGAFDETKGNIGENRKRIIKRLPNNINCRVPNITSEEMILRLDAKGFALSHKSACASEEGNGSYVLQALGVSEKESLENIRITMGRDTTKDDMKNLILAMKEIKEKFAH